MTKRHELDKPTIKYLRSLAHALKPIVLMGQNGLTDAVTRELDGALDHHELVKIKLSGADREERQSRLDTLCETLEAVVVQQIGHTATLFRRNTKKPVIELSLARR